MPRSSARADGSKLGVSFYLIQLPLFAMLACVFLFAGVVCGVIPIDLRRFSRVSLKKRFLQFFVRDKHHIAPAVTYEIDGSRSPLAPGNPDLLKERRGATIRVMTSIEIKERLTGAPVVLKDNVEYFLARGQEVQFTRTAIAEE